MLIGETDTDTHTENTQRQNRQIHKTAFRQTEIQNHTTEDRR